MEIPANKLIHEVSSALQRLKVYETDELRLLRSDDQYTQSAMHLARPERLVLPYMQTMMAGLLFAPEPKEIVLLGLGGGDLIRYLNHYLPTAQLTAIENDSAMHAIARDYFALPQNEHIHIQIDDAKQYLARETQKVDWLLIDLFSQQKMPDLLDEAGFYADCYQHLNSNGVLVLNFVSEDSELFKNILWKLRCQFNHATLCMTVANHLNVLIFAFRQRPDCVNRNTLTDKARVLTSKFDLDFEGIVDNLFTTNPLADDELSF